MMLMNPCLILSQIFKEINYSAHLFLDLYFNIPELIFASRQLTVLCRAYSIKVILMPLQ